ncbi:hypothetical protein C8J57DRAFT_978067, partial [Mycena rebaudengoi]
FEAWRAAQQLDNCIELRLTHTFNGLPEYERQLRFVCSRAGTGGNKPYIKIHPEWSRKLSPKRTDCQSSLTVKQYPGISVILGNYREEHNHPTGNANLQFLQIPKDTREYIAGLLRLKVSADHIVSHLHNKILERSNRRLIAKTSASRQRTEFITLRDIRHIQKDIEAEDVRLHPDDGQSVLRWVELLRANGHLLGFKSKTDPPPPGSNLPQNVFTLMIQTDWQRHMFQKYGEPLVCIDATHNTT